MAAEQGPDDVKVEQSNNARRVDLVPDEVPNSTSGDAQALDKSQETSNLQDALASAGVDLQQEEQNMTFGVKDGESISDNLAQAKSRFSDFLNYNVLETILQRNLNNSRLERFNPELLSLLSLSLKERLLLLLRRGSLLCKHRTALPPKNAVIVDNVRQTLKKIAEADRKHEEEFKAQLAKRKAESEAQKAEQEAAAFTEDGMAPKRKARKDAITNLISEETRKRLADQTADIATGLAGRQYSWLSAEKESLPAIGGGFGIMKKKKKHDPELPSEGKEADKTWRGYLPLIIQDNHLITVRDIQLAMELDATKSLDIDGGGMKSYLKVNLKD